MSRTWLLVVVVVVLAACGSSWSLPTGNSDLAHSIETTVSSESSESQEATGSLSELELTPIDSSDEDERKTNGTEPESVMEDARPANQGDSSEEVDGQAREVAAPVAEKMEDKEEAANTSEE